MCAGSGGGGGNPPVAMAFWTAVNKSPPSEPILWSPPFEICVAEDCVRKSSSVTVGYSSKDPQMAQKKAAVRMLQSTEEETGTNLHADARRCDPYTQTQKHAHARAQRGHALRCVHCANPPRARFLTFADGRAVVVRSYVRTERGGPFRTLVTVGARPKAKVGAAVRHVEREGCALVNHCRDPAVKI